MMDSGLAFLLGIGVGMLLIGALNAALEHHCPNGCELRFEQLSPEDAP